MDNFDTFLDYILDPKTDKTKINWSLAKRDFPDKNIDLMMRDFGISGSNIPLPSLSVPDPLQMQKLNLQPSGVPLSPIEKMSVGDVLKKGGRVLAAGIESLPSKIPFPLPVAGGTKESVGAWWKPKGEITDENRWEAGMVSLTDFMKRFQMVGRKQIAKNPSGNLLKTLYNAGVGGGQLLGSLPQFLMTDLPVGAVKTLTPGEEGLGAMGKQMLSDTGDVIKYVYLKQFETDKWKEWRKTDEGKRIETMINEEPLRPLMSPMIFAGLTSKGGKMSGAFGDLSQARRLGFSTRDYIDMKRSGFELDAYERRLEAEKGKVSERELPAGFNYQAVKGILERPISEDIKAKPEPEIKIEPSWIQRKHPAGISSVNKIADVKEPVGAEALRLKKAIDTANELKDIDGKIDELYKQRDITSTLKHNEIDRRIRILDERKLILINSESGKILLPETSADVSKLIRAIFPIGRPGRTLDKSNIDVTQEMVQRTIKAETSARIIRGTATTILEDAQKKARLTATDRNWMRENFKSNYETGNPMPNERIQIYADGFRKVMATIGDYAEGLNIKVRKRQFGQQANYVTDILTDRGHRALEARSGDVFQAIIADLNKRGKSTEGLQAFIEELQPGQEADIVRRHGSLEHPKLLDLPDKVVVNGKTVKILETDPFVIAEKYIHTAPRRLGIIQYFGQGNTTVYSILDKIGDNPELRQLVTNVWNDLQGLSKGAQMPGALGTVGRGLEVAVRGQLLSLASLANVTGYSPIIAKYGLRNTIKAFGESWAGSEAVEFNRRAGGWFKDIFEEHAAVTDFEGRVGRITKKELQWTGFNGINRNINKVAGRAAQMAVEDALNILRKNDTAGMLRELQTSRKQLIRQLTEDFYFTEADITRMARDGMSPTDMARVAQRAPAIVNVMGESVLDRPSWMRKPIARRILAYTSFGRAMGNIMADAFSQAKVGNFKLLSKMLFGATVAGETETFLKNWVKNRERTDKDIWDRLANDIFASMTLGLPGIALERAKWSLSVSQEGPISSNLPPGLEIIDEFAVDLAQAIKDGSLRKGIQATLKPVQIAHAIGGTVHRLIKPEEAKKARIEKQREIYKRMYSADYNKAIRDNDFNEAIKIQREALKHGVYLKFPSIKPKEEPTIYEMLGAK